MTDQATDNSWPVGSLVERPVGPAAEARWYCLSRDGAATLCVDEEDANDVAAESWVLYPHNGPYRVARMIDEAEADARVFAERDSYAELLRLALGALESESAWGGPTPKTAAAMAALREALGPNARAMRHARKEDR